jgi:myo-inositol-hexaphosphate 3-phosphohydrolase
MTAIAPNPTCRPSAGAHAVKRHVYAWPILALGLAVLGCVPVTPSESTEPPPSPSPPVASATPSESTGSAGPTDFAPFETRTLNPQFMVDGAGLNIDSIAFWEAPDPADTLMFVTAKDNQLVEVWRYPFAGNELQPLTHPTFASNSKVNGVAVDQATDRLYVAISRPRSTVSVFALPSLTHVAQYIDGSLSLGSEPNLALLNHSDGTRLYVSADERVFILDAATGSDIGQFEPVKGLETLVGDDREQVLYVPDENDRTGVYAYAPDGAAHLRQGTNVFGSTDFESDAEGILLYTCPSSGTGDDGRGLIVVADQRSDQTDFEVYDRQTWQHLGVIRLTDVKNTDGVASTQRPLPAYPMGLFVAVDNDKRVAGIGWDRILSATGLSCDA